MPIPPEDARVAPPLVYSAASPDAPTLISASAIAQKTVRVTYDQYVKASNPSDPDDALNPSNYSFVAGGGATGITPASVAAVSTSVFDVTLNEEMTNGGSYTLTINNVVNLLGEVISAPWNQTAFTGLGVQPQVSAAVAIDAFTVRVTFNEAMLQNAALINKDNYTIATFPGAAPDVLSVSVVDSTHVDCTTEEQRDGASYAISVVNVYDIALNPIDLAHNSAGFTGVGEGPYFTQVRATGNLTVEATFNEDVVLGEAVDKTNWTFYKTAAPGVPLAIDSVASISLSKYEITLVAGMESGVSYTVEATDIHDLIGNPVDPDPATDTFTGIGNSPPNIIFSPEDDTREVPLRTYVRVTLVDDSEEFTGIEETATRIVVRYLDAVGVGVDEKVVWNGVIQSGFDAYSKGDPLSTSGISYYFRPKGKVWQANKQYEIEVYAEDIEGANNTQISTFTTGVPICFEDNLPALTQLEAKIIAGTGYPNTDKLLKLFLSKCTQSVSKHIQARTLMWHAASVTDLRSLLTGIFDFNLTATIQLCDRQPVSVIYSALASKVSLAYAAINETTIVNEHAKQLMRTRLNNNSPVYVVNTMAVILMMAILEAMLKEA
jgi:hypothetical protein